MRNGPASLPMSLIPADMRRRRIRSRQLGQPEIIESIQEFANGPQSIPYDALPIDMRQRPIQEWKRNVDGSIVPSSGEYASPLEQYLSRIADDTSAISSTLVLSRGLLGRTVLVTTVPQLIINAEFLRGYILLNPNETAGATAAGTLLASASRGVTTADATGNSSTLGVANFLSAHYFVNVTAVAGGGTLDVVLQALDPVSGTFFDVQNLVLGVGVSSTYGYVGELGTPTDIRVRWNIPAGDVTFSVGFVLKNGLIGTSSGISQTIFLGGPGVTVESGFPLLNAQSQKFFLRENVQLYAVANATLPLKIFEL